MVIKKLRKHLSSKRGPVFKGLKKTTRYTGKILKSNIKSASRYTRSRLKKNYPKIKKSIGNYLINAKREHGRYKTTEEQIKENVFGLRSRVPKSSPGKKHKKVRTKLKYKTRYIQPKPRPRYYPDYYYPPVPRRRSRPEVKKIKRRKRTKSSRGSYSNGGYFSGMPRTIADSISYG